MLLGKNYKGNWIRQLKIISTPCGMILLLSRSWNFRRLLLEWPGALCVMLFPTVGG